MSGSTKAALRASAGMPRPKSQTVYLTRTRPIMRERKVETMRSTVAEKAECACAGCSIPRRRASVERGSAWG